MTMQVSALILPLVFLLGSATLTVMMKALRVLGRIQVKNVFAKSPKLFFFYFWQRKLFPGDEWNNIYFMISVSQQILRLLYSVFVIITTLSILNWSIPIMIGVALFIEFLFRLITSYRPAFMLTLTIPFATLCLLCASPITFSLLFIQRLIFPAKNKSRNQVNLKDQILDLVHETELSSRLDATDRRLITSFASFRERMAREIMVPRIDLFSLSVNQTVHEAALKFISEGYSRIPVYKESVDQIIGVLLYKDVMQFYIDCVEKGNKAPLETPLKELISPILYTPETKKISNLLQEFRSKHIHLAIVVDEYGGTEGIVTIEDILEELVGEIADEYDFDEEALFRPMPGGGWAVDSKMNILDIEKELKVHLPQSPEYDTIGGFVYHCAGTIPEKGWRIHTDEYDIEILSSTDRAIDQIWLKKS